MTKYNSTLHYLYGLQGRGMKFGLRNIRTMLKAAGNPERRFPSIHIAGTNGKGSTSCFTASILQEAGIRTGLYTSPHLVRFTERIRINGAEMPEHRLVEYAMKLKPIVEELHATFFEATTCIAFQYFADERVDVAVIETGLGGRLDSTNVLIPMVSLITNVSFDHMEYLGSTLKSISREKGGIIKNRVPCVTGATGAEVLAVLNRIARRKHAKLWAVQSLVKSHSRDSAAFGTKATFTGAHIRVPETTIGLRGSHQVENAAAAVAAVEILKRRKSGPEWVRRLDTPSVRRGLENVRRNTGLHGRLEVIAKRLIIDVAHNPDGLKTLLNALPEGKIRDMVVMFGVMKDKDYLPMLELLAGTKAKIVAVQPKTKRALPSKVISDMLRSRGADATDGKGVKSGLALARRLAGRRRDVLVTGSHYVVGEALSLLE